MKEIKRERKIEEVTGYEAFDGKWFKEKEECEKYERSAYGVIAKEFESLFVRERFAECSIWEEYGYGSEEFEMAIIYIKDANDLHTANKYYELVSNGGCKLIGTEYIGKKILVNLGYSYDRYVPPCPRTMEDLMRAFESNLDSFFNPVIETKTEETKGE